MNSADVLQSIAEVAIALAGFGGIAAGLGYRTRGVWSIDDRTRLIGMAVVSLLVVFACFLPFVISQFGVAVPWRIASCIVLPIAATYLAGQLWVNRAGAPEGASWLTIRSLYAMQASVISLLAFAALGLAAAYHSGLYLSAILLELLLASVLFVRLLLTSFRDSEPAA